MPDTRTFFAQGMLFTVAVETAFDGDDLDVFYDGLKETIESWSVEEARALYSGTQAGITVDLDDESYFLAYIEAKHGHIKVLSVSKPGEPKPDNYNVLFRKP
jgi:hypothetical protein